MKALFIILFSIITHAALAQDGQLIGLKLQSGRKISLVDEVRKLEVSERKVEQVELKNGEVYYDFEIDQAVIKIPNGRTINVNLDSVRLNERLERESQEGRTLAVGGDGSGGG